MRHRSFPDAEERVAQLRCAAEAGKDGGCEKPRGTRKGTKQSDVKIRNLGKIWEMWRVLEEFGDLVWENLGVLDRFWDLVF